MGWFSSLWSSTHIKLTEPYLQMLYLHRCSCVWKRIGNLYWMCYDIENIVFSMGFFPPSWLLCMWCLLLCIYKVCKDFKNPNISTMALSSPRIQVSSSPSTPSTLRALTIIYWWQRTAASLSHFGGWRAPPCLRLSAQGCLETTQHRSASCLTFPFRMRDSTSPSLVRINLVLWI